MKQLEESGFPFENGWLIRRRIIWEERYQELVDYMKVHKMNYAHVPQHKNSKHPYASLGQWCAAQKLRRKGISPPVWTEYEEQKMNSINFKWQTPKVSLGSSPDDESWLNNYFKLEEYKKKFGHANPSQTDKDPEIKKLAKWVNDQRTLKNTGRKTKQGILKKLIKEREELLTELGVDWEYQMTQRRKELEEFIVGYLELKKLYPDEKPAYGDTRFSKVLQKKAEIKFRYRNNKSPENKWRVDRLNEIGFRWI